MNNKQWEPGEGIERHGRGQGHSFSVDAYQIIANMICALGKRTDGDLAHVAAFLGIPSRQRGVDAPTIISHWANINVKLCATFGTACVDLIIVYTARWPVAPCPLCWRA